ncbi:MAG: SUMF1/EgtB/PvdO family nonheme iron enzyme, partial [Candidatus Delongbacteria bacterium]|nr:SUMF1/EgtB/PvdO family nonheme iron enzyme [Candidatus Delongbacteria bacterium]
MKKIEIIVYIILSLIMILYSEPLDMVLVEGGTFEMGSDIGESDEKPVRSISIKDFYIGKYEVTQKE